MAGGVVSLPAGGSLARDLSSECSAFVNEKDEREGRLMQKIRAIRHRQEEERRRIRNNPAARQAEREKVLKRVEKRYEEAKEHIARRLEAEALITDYDPKQGGTYFSRLYYVLDPITFDYDEESPLGPMRYTNRIYDNDNYMLCEAINILSLKIASSDVGFPLQVHGTVIARDSIDQKLVYLFKRDGDNCQVVNSEDESLILIGPKRGLALMSAAYVETNLKIRDCQGQDIEFSKGVLEIKGMERRSLKKCELESCSLSTRLSTVDMLYAVVKGAVEATIEVGLLQGEFCGDVTACTSSIGNEVVLHDGKLAGGTIYRTRSRIPLLRSVVSVSLKEKLFVTIVARNADGEGKCTLRITPEVNGATLENVGVGFAILWLKVTWSVIDF